MDSKQDITGIKMGMWLFLYTEIMLFGGLFILYAVYYHRYTDQFVENGKDLDLLTGAVNTLILLASSFTMAASITAVRKGLKRAAISLISVSILLGAAFLVNKYFEWGHKFEAGIYPGSDLLADAAPGKNIFYGLYFVLTGLHGVHIIIGLALLGTCLAMTIAGRIRPERYVLLDNSGLYWHLVDLVWIFLFPLFYLLL
jgi:cytochrome c oxidase subunit 3